MIYGEFLSNRGSFYKIEIDCKTQYQIGSSSVLNFTDDPLEIELDCDDTLEHIVKTSASIRLITSSYLWNELFTGNDRDIKVRIYRADKPKTTSATVSLDYKPIFYGYVLPLSYSLDFAEKYCEVEISCYDFLSTLDNHKWKETQDYDDVKKNAGTLTFKSILDTIFSKYKEDFGAYYFADGPENVSGIAISEKQPWYFEISESMLLGDDEDDLMTEEEVLEEILKFTNKHIFLDNQDGYPMYYNMVDYQYQVENIGNQTIRKTFNGSYGSSNVTYNTLVIDASYYASDDTQVSMADIYNKITVTDDLTDAETLFESPLEEDSLITPFDKKYKYATEGYHKDKEYTDAEFPLNDWYFQYKQNTNWTMRYNKYQKNNSYTIYNTEDILKENCYNKTTGKYVNQYLIPQTINLSLMCPCLCGLGKIDAEKKSDNTVYNNLSMDDLIIISVNGTATDFFSLKMPELVKSRLEIFNNLNDAYEKAGGMIEYKSTTSVGSITPTDPTITNYIVFSGKITLQSVYPNSLVSALFSHEDKHFTETYYNDSGSTLPKDSSNKLDSANLSPALKYDEWNKSFSEKYGDWFYVKDLQDVDYITKIPVLICQLKIGDKYCCEADDNVFTWYTQEEAAKVGITALTFTLGINPKIGDYLLNTEWDIANTLDIWSNVDTEGTAIPIKLSDKLSGQIEFRIIGLNYIGWEQQIRKHPTAFRHTKWWTTDLYMMEYIRDVIVKDFECEIYSDNGLITAPSQDKDLVYTSNIKNNSIQEEDISFKFNTGLTAAECAEKGITAAARTSYVTYGGDPITSVYRFGQTAKAEEFYIDLYYREYNHMSPIIETTLKFNKVPISQLFFSFNYSKVMGLLGDSIDFNNMYRLGYTISGQEDNITITCKKITYSE